MSGWRRPAAYTAGLTLVSLVAMEVTSMQPSVVTVVAVGALIGIVFWFAREVGLSAQPAPLGPAVDAPPPTSRERRVNALRTGITFTQSSHDNHSRALYDTLVELIEDQLLAVHGLDLTTSPAAARAIVGDELFDFAHHDSPASALSRIKDLDRIVTLIEQI